jgi:hypothetical protein
MQRGKQGQLNALIGLGILLAALGLGAFVMFLAHHVGMPWLPAPVFALLAAGAVAFYAMNLNHLERIALERRVEISAALCRAG